MRAVHSGFYLSPHTISIGLIGPGAVARVLLEQIAAERERLLRDFKLDLRVRGIMTSKKMLLSEQGIDLDSAGEGRARRRADARRSSRSSSSTCTSITCRTR